MALTPRGLPEVPSLHLQISHRDCKCHHCVSPFFIAKIRIGHTFFYQTDIWPGHKRALITKQRRAEPESKHIYGRVRNVESLPDIAAELLCIHAAKTLQSQVHCTVAHQVHQQILSWRNTRVTLVISGQQWSDRDLRSDPERNQKNPLRNREQTSGDWGSHTSSLGLRVLWWLREEVAIISLHLIQKQTQVLNRKHKKRWYIRYFCFLLLAYS